MGGDWTGAWMPHNPAAPKSQLLPQASRPSLSPELGPRDGRASVSETPPKRPDGFRLLRPMPSAFAFAAAECPSAGRHFSTSPSDETHSRQWGVVCNLLPEGDQYPVLRKTHCAPASSLVRPHRLVWSGCFERFFQESFTLSFSTVRQLGALGAFCFAALLGNRDSHTHRAPHPLRQAALQASRGLI